MGRERESESERERERGRKTGTGKIYCQDMWVNDIRRLWRLKQLKPNFSQPWENPLRALKRSEREGNLSSMRAWRICVLNTVCACAFKTTMLQYTNSCSAECIISWTALEESISCFFQRFQKGCTPSLVWRQYSCQWKEHIVSCSCIQILSKSKC